MLQTLFLDIMAEEALATLAEGMKQLQKEMSARKDNYSFKRRGNELQFRFNEELAEKVEAAKAIVESVEVQSGSRSEEQLQRVAAEMSEGMKLLTRRQKLKVC